ncbi:MAG: hypothetical protein COC23_01305 [Hyphomicrobiales bacterium]|nr:MAG: hypothetical protein COC23_01305 [Hyphomicrobiales bacterium]
MLRIENLVFRHNEGGPNYQFSLDAEPGEIICIKGQSGSGKSTFLDLIAGFQLPQSGVLEWQGHDLLLQPPENRPVTILFQKDNLFEHLSAGQNVALGAKSRASQKPRNVDQQVLTALKKVGLEGQFDQRAATLSGGQQQRVALARAMVRDKPILLLDEPFTGLDDDTRNEMYRLILSLAEDEQRCILLVTHDQADCDALATRQMHIQNGRLSEA